MKPVKLKYGSRTSTTLVHKESLISNYSGYVEDEIILDIMDLLNGDIEINKFHPIELLNAIVYYNIFPDLEERIKQIYIHNFEYYKINDLIVFGNILNDIIFNNQNIFNAAAPELSLRELMDDMQYSKILVKNNEFFLIYGNNVLICLPTEVKNYCDKDNIILSLEEINHPPEKSIKIGDYYLYVTEMGKMDIVEPEYIVDALSIMDYINKLPLEEIKNIKKDFSLFDITMFQIIKYSNGNLQVELNELYYGLKYCPKKIEAQKYIIEYPPVLDYIFTLIMSN